jgi:alkylation response protein AidB-like acyl-CoA dehydrogenase
MADAKELDIRVEAALAKMWHTEAAWHMVDEALQIRGRTGVRDGRLAAGAGRDPLARRAGHA